MSGAPRTSEDNHWMDLHEHFVSEARDKEADVIFIGDDHIALLEQSTYYRENIAPLHCLAFGCLGDTVEHVIWRIENGELSNITPKMIVLSVGVNESLDTTPFLNSLSSLVQLVTQKQPTSRIFVMKLLPCGKRENPRREFINEVNGKLESTLGQLATTIDVDPSILSADGQIDPHIMFDYVHLTQEGYGRVFEAVQVTLASALNP